MSDDSKSIQETWEAFLKKWPIERLRKMTLAEYSTAGDNDTFTAWIESRLDQMGSIWGGTSFKFGIFSRKSKEHKESGTGFTYTDDHAWYPKYGHSAEEVFAKVRSLVVQTAEAAKRGDYAVIDSIDLGTAYKWKIAFHYQDLGHPGVIALFKADRLQRWLSGRTKNIPEEMSELYRAVLSFRGNRDFVEFSREIWEATEDPDAVVVPPLDPVDEPQPLNLILYGPPGTGKTYVTAEMAVRICDGTVPEERRALMARYRELVNLRRIRFVTFHPSFAYEEFVEGIRPATVDGTVRYDVRSGVFKQTAVKARELYESRGSSPHGIDLQGRRLFKMSLGDSRREEDSWIYRECIDGSYVTVGFAPQVDFSNAETLHAARDKYLASTPGASGTDYAPVAVNYLRTEMHDGDLVLISEGNTRFRALGEISGPYSYDATRNEYAHRRPVRWLWHSEESLPIDTVFSKRLSQMTIYLMDQDAVKWAALSELVAPRRSGLAAPNCVLIIDEINRANLSKTFGELITLLEPSKRLGGADEREVELPYSGELFGVPPNLYVIGTMNTADRSIALMDTALRRRFAFKEMASQVHLLPKDVAGIDLQALLLAMNRRIETLFDRDHILGHTYLMGLSSADDLIARFRDQIIPLLQEYFFDDWKRIQQVFNDVDAKRDQQIIQSVEVDEPGVAFGAQKSRFQVNPEITPAAIQKIYA